MPPVLALVLCTVYVLFLLLLEKKQSSDVTRALWVPTLWMLSIASKPLAVWFPGSGATPESSPLDRMFLILLLMAAVAVLARRKFDWRAALAENRAVVALLGFMLLSISWSGAPVTSINRWVRELQALLMAFVVLSEPSPQRAIESLLRRTIYLLVPFSIVLVKYFPYYGVQYGSWSGARMWVGVTQQKNGLGRLCVIAVFFLVWTFVRRRQGRAPAVRKSQTAAELSVLGLSLILLRGPGGRAYSATSLVALALGLLIYGALGLARKRGWTVSAGLPAAAVAGLFLFGIASLFTGGSALGSFAPRLGRNATLTDRTEIWSILFPLALQRPLLGHGLGGFWTPRLRKEIISEAHNGYLDALLDLGFAGLFLIGVFAVSSARKAQRELKDHFDWGALGFCFVAILVVHNYAESSIDTLTSQLTATVLFISVAYSRRPMRDGEAGRGMTLARAREDERPGKGTSETS